MMSDNQNISFLRYWLFKIGDCMGLDGRDSGDLIGVLWKVVLFGDIQCCGGSFGLGWSDGGFGVVRLSSGECWNESSNKLLLPRPRTSPSLTQVELPKDENSKHGSSIQDVWEM